MVVARQLGETAAKCKSICVCGNTCRWAKICSFVSTNKVFNLQKCKSCNKKKCKVWGYLSQKHCQCVFWWLCCVRASVVSQETRGQEQQRRRPAGLRLEPDHCDCRATGETGTCNQEPSVGFRLLVGGQRAVSCTQPGWLWYMERVSYSVIKHATVCPSSQPCVCAFVYMLLVTSNLVMRR